MLRVLLIIVCFGFALLGLKKGLYVMFATLFNLLFAIFISILSTRTLLSLSPEFERNGYYAALIVFLLFCLVFGLLQMFAWFYFLRIREDYFPKMLDRVAGFFVGGVCGYILFSLLVLILFIMPFSVEGKMNWLCTREQMMERSKPVVLKACNFLAWYSLECFDGETEEEVKELLQLSEPQEQEEILYYVPQNRRSNNSIQRYPRSN